MGIDPRFAGIRGRIRFRVALAACIGAGCATPIARADAPLPRLAAILGWGDERRVILAWPNGQAGAVVGDQVDAVRILAIDTDSVLIERKGTQYILTLEGAGTAPPNPIPALPGGTFPGETRGLAVYAQRPAPD